jgi:putative Mg2+ transporter-C (MgtC) family protein
MPTDLAFQAEMSLRLIAGTLFGAAVGLEREVHGHPAGMRTHMPVSLGSAVFTIEVESIERVEEA